MLGLLRLGLLGLGLGPMLGQEAPEIERKLGKEAGQATSDKQQATTKHASKQARATARAITTATATAMARAGLVGEEERKTKREDEG